MSKAIKDNYLNLLQVSSDSWGSDDDEVRIARQKVLDHLVSKWSVEEEDIAHLR